VVFVHFVDYLCLSIRHGNVTRATDRLLGHFTDKQLT